MNKPDQDQAGGQPLDPQSDITELQQKILYYEQKYEREKMETIKDTQGNTYFMSNLRLGKYKAYHYFLLLKVFTNHMHDQEFESSKRALYFAFGLPIVVTAGFGLVNPFSVFRNMA